MDKQRRATLHLPSVSVLIDGEADSLSSSGGEGKGEEAVLLSSRHT
jgi:hypothetical protein